MQKGFVESFDGRFRDGLLDETLFASLTDARQKIRARQEDCNHHCPHSGLGTIPPAAFVAKNGPGDTCRQTSTGGLRVRPEGRRVSGHGFQKFFPSISLSIAKSSMCSASPFFSFAGAGHRPRANRSHLCRARGNPALVLSLALCANDPGDVRFDRALVADVTR